MVKIPDTDCDTELVFRDGDSWSSYARCALTLKVTMANQGREGEVAAIFKKRWWCMILIIITEDSNSCQRLQRGRYVVHTMLSPLMCHPTAPS